MPIPADRPAKRYTAKQFTEWRARWSGIEPDEALRNPPFGTTEDGLLDFRGITMRKPGLGWLKKFNHAQFKMCAFTAASLAETNCSLCIFQDCVFDYTDLNNFRDYGCHFTNCRFYRSEWQVGAIGFDTSSATRGEYQSRYINCHFENIKLTKTVIDDPQFIDCNFVFKKLIGLDFGCSGFVACRFIGAFQDLTFRGTYERENDRTRKGHPEFAGFTDVSFERAALQWFDMRGGFRCDHLRMPSDGSAFTADLPRLCADRASLLERMNDPPLHKIASRYFDLYCRFADEQKIQIVSRFELIEIASNAGEPDTLADTLYATLKSTYATPT